MFLAPANWSRSHRGATNNKLLVIGIASAPRSSCERPQTEGNLTEGGHSSQGLAHCIYNLNLD